MAYFGWWTETFRTRVETSKGTSGRHDHLAPCASARKSPQSWQAPTNRPVHQQVPRVRRQRREDWLDLPVPHTSCGTRVTVALRSETPRVQSPQPPSSCRLCRRSCRAHQHSDAFARRLGIHKQLDLPMDLMILRGPAPRNSRPRPQPDGEAPAPGDGAFTAGEGTLSPRSGAPVRRERDRLQNAERPQHGALHRRKPSRWRPQHVRKPSYTRRVVTGADLFSGSKTRDTQRRKKRASRRRRASGLARSPTHFTGRETDAGLTKSEGSHSRASRPSCDAAGRDPP